MKITRLTADHLRVPFGKPTRIALAADRPPIGPEAVDLVLVHLETDTGVSGLGFASVVGAGAGAVRSLIDTELSPLVVDCDPRDTDRLLSKVEARFRAVGFAGLAEGEAGFALGFLDALFDFASFLGGEGGDENESGG